VTSGFRLDRGRLVLGEAVYVYLERARAEPRALPPDVVPRPHGIAPVATMPDGHLVAAVGRDEAVWLGFQPVERGRTTVVRVRLERAEPLDAITGRPWQDETRGAPRNHLLVPPDSRLVGLPVDDGIRPFAAPDQLTILAGSPPVCARVRLVPPGSFADLTGATPAPLDADAAYTGWRAI
jgi:hypothetical protein